MTQRGALSCLMLSDQVYQNKLLYSEKMLCKWGLWRKAWKSDPYVLCRSCPRHREVWEAVGVKDNANFKKGGYIQQSIKLCRYENCMCAGSQSETPRHPLPPEVLLSGQQHFMSSASPVGICLQQAAAMQLFTAAIAALVYALEWDYLGGLGDWAGMRTSRLRLKPAKTEITREVQQAGGGGEDRKDKPVSALPPNSAALYTQIKFEAQRSCYRRSWYYSRATSKSLFSSSALGKERVTSYFRCGFLTFTIFWSP